MGGPVAEGLPSTHLDDTVDRTLEKAVRRLVSSEVGLPVRYFEQLYTFGDQERAPGGRELAVAYLALTRFQATHGPGSPGWRSFSPGKTGAGAGRKCSTRSSCRPSTGGWTGQHPVTCPRGASERS